MQNTHESPKPVPFQPESRTDAFALEVARTLKEESGLPRYRTFCQRYDEELIRRALSTVKSIPEDRIKKSRAALFFYLVKKYAGEIE